MSERGYEDHLEATHVSRVEQQRNGMRLPSGVHVIALRQQ